MKPLRLITRLLVLVVLAMLPTAPKASAQTVPSSTRSEAALQRVTADVARDMATQGFELGASVFLRIFKEEAELEVWVEKDGSFALYKSFAICDFSGDLGPKEREGDLQSPEGFYWVPARMFNPASDYHLSFNLGYPNRLDRQLGRTGNYLMVHGSCVSIGCYAMTDAGIEEIWAITTAALGAGQRYFRVHAMPFKMTDANMAAHEGSEWFNWWQELKTGYDYFESNKRPPDVTARRGHYVFADAERATE
ncbi:MAG: murein L,D-transpeptidase [Kordiimonadaceae bacterium]|nr:murein L,D-transpeptidase [Kordiimonadaceae bacterium]